MKRSSSGEDRISWYPMFFLFSVVYFSSGTLPTKKGERRALPRRIAMVQ